MSSHHLHLPQFVEADLWTLLAERLATAAFTRRVARRVHPPAVDLKLADPVLQGGLRWMLADVKLCRAIEWVTGERGLTSFNGAVYRLEPGGHHHDSWHNDVDGRRRVGITVNFSTAAFHGGELEMRDARTHDRLWRFANTAPGDALLFAIDLSLEHRIAPMRGTVPKTALAGWFCTAAE
jgi:hypothetical protein